MAPKFYSAYLTAIPCTKAVILTPSLSLPRLPQCASRALQRPLLSRYQSLTQYVVVAIQSVGDHTRFRYYCESHIYSQSIQHCRFGLSVWLLPARSRQLTLIFSRQLSPTTNIPSSTPTLPSLSVTSASSVNIAGPSSTLRPSTSTTVGSDCLYGSHRHVTRSLD